MRRWVVDWLTIIGLGIGAVYVVVVSSRPLFAVLGVVVFAVGLTPGIWYWWEHRRKENE